MSDRPEYWYTVHLTGSAGQPRTVDTLAHNALEAEVAVIKMAGESWPTSGPWRCVKSMRTRP